MPRAAPLETICRMAMVDFKRATEPLTNKTINQGVTNADGVPIVSMYVGAKGNIHVRQSVVIYIGQQPKLVDELKKTYSTTPTYALRRINSNAHNYKHT